MPRPKKYESAAEKQAAYRARKRAATSLKEILQEKNEPGPDDDSIQMVETKINEPRYVTRRPNVTLRDGIRDGIRRESIHNRTSNTENQVDLDQKYVPSIPLKMQEQQDVIKMVNTRIMNPKRFFEKYRVVRI